ncbi:MAG: hypothetical protein KDK39_03745 [Leptospiraceae bacterium]|nr:hypothetical protein [Leptospiraceae bacterium]
MTSLANIKGQAVASRLLENSLQQGPPPLLILHGPEGTGRFLAALAYIQHSLCETGTACGVCVPCKKILQNMHPDLILFPAERVSIGNPDHPEPFSIRWLIRKRLVYQPHEARYRFVVFPRADLLLTEAESALLKTLEDAPEHTRFLMLTHRLDQLSPTIRSRAVTVPFYGLSSPAMRSILPDTVSNDDLTILGGSLDQLELLHSDLTNDMATRIEAALRHPVSLLDLESWLISLEKNSPGTGTTYSASLSYPELLDFFGLLLLMKTESHKRFKQIAPLIFEFKGTLHRKVAGIQVFLVARLFHQLHTTLFSR